MQKIDLRSRAGRKGQTGYSFTGVNRNVQRLQTSRFIRNIPDFNTIYTIVRDLFQPFGQRKPIEVAIIKGGLKINGGSCWKIGTACLYRTSADTNESLDLCCGVISRIIEWKNDIDTYLLVEVLPHELKSFSRLRATATISKKPIQVRRVLGPRCPENLKDADPVWMSWKRLTHYCKILPCVGNGGDDSEATLVLVNATNPLNDAAHYGAVNSMASRPL